MPNRKRQPKPRPRLEQSAPRLCPAGKHGPYFPEEDSVYDRASGKAECAECVLAERNDLRQAARTAKSNLLVATKGPQVSVDASIQHAITVLGRALGDE